MAAIEKLVKSLEILKDLQLSPQVSDELAVRRREKIASCVSIADTLCNTSFKASPNMASLLTHSIQSLLQLCDDEDSNVHMVAEESLNRIIRAVTDNNVAKIQLEFHKEMKRNGNPRSLRAALWRYAQLSHLIKPSRGKAHVANLVPCLVQISNRQEEAVQETLAASLPLILKSLGMFTTDKDIKELLKAFLQNLSSKVSPIRRTAASCILCICRNSRKPQEFLSYVITTLLDSISIREGQTVCEVLGVFGCLRAVLPAINQSGTSESSSIRHGAQKGRLGVNSYVKVLELSLHYTRHTDHNVVNAALELLLLLLQSPPNELLPLLLSPHGISKAHMSSMCEEKGFSMRSLSQLSVATATSGAAADDSVLPDLDETSSVYSEASTVDRWVQDTSITSLGSEGTPSRPQLQLIDVSDGQLPPDLTSDILAEAESGSPQALPLLTQIPLDLEPEPETTPPPSVGISFGSLTASPSASGAGDIRYQVFPVPQVCDIGSLTDGSVPLVFLARHIATSFLLTGYPGYWIPDRAVRVSVKALALSCIAALVRLLPNTFQLYLDRDPGLSNCNFPSQPMSDLLLYANHTDPQLRAVCRSLISSLVRAVLVQSGGDWSSWQKKADYTVSSLLSLERLVDLLLQGFKDESSTTCRLTLAAVTPTLPVLLESRDRACAVPLLCALPELAKNPYWLVKVKLAELVDELPMLAVQEAAGPDLQNQLIEDTLLVLLGDEDARVRKAATEAFVKLTHVLFYPVDHEGRDFVLAKAFHLVDVQLGPFLQDSTRLSNLTMGPLDNLVPPFDAWSAHILSPEKSKMHRIREAVLARIVHLLTKTLYECSDKYLTLGCCEALSALATEYSPTVYQLAWGCSLGNSKCSSRRKSMDSALPYNRLLGATMSLLLNSPIAVELSAQQQLLTLAGNLLCGCAMAALNTNSSQQWSLFKDKQLSVLAENLLGHIIRLLNVLVHVVDDSSAPSGGGTKSTLSSFPMGQSLSPIKRHGSTASSKSVTSASFDSGLDAKASKGMSPMKTVMNHGEKEEKSDEKKGKTPPMGAFSHLPHYVKIYELVKSAYSAYKVSLATEANDKLEGIVRATLTTLSSLLEVMNVLEAEKVAEELLTFLRSVMGLAPDHTVVCVNQLLKCLVGMNLSALWGEVVNSFDTNGYQDPPDSSKETSKSGRSFHQICFQEPAHKMERFLQSILAKTDHAPDEGNYLKWMNMNRRLSDSKLSPVGGLNMDMSYLASYIRLFEPMVIESMQQYRVTNNVNLQSRILTLLTQLVNLRINYCLLDSEMIFINHIHKQFEFIEEGKVPQASELVSKIFHFLVLLSFEKHHSKSITTIPSVIQLCDTLMASEQNPLTHCIPALIPVVEHVFLSRYVAELSIDTNELETQRDVLVARLLRLVEYHQVMELLSVVLNASRVWADGAERWNRWSSQVADYLFPMLAERRLRLDTHEALRALHNLLLHSMDPATLRPVDPLLRVLFAPPPPSDSGVLSTIRWLGGVNVALLTLLAEGREAATLARIDELKLVIHTVLGHPTTDLVSPDPATSPPITDAHESSPPQLLMARLLIRVAGLAGERVANLVLDPAASPEVLDQCQLLQQLVAHFLLTIIHMLQSGSYCQIVSAAIQLVSNPTTEDALLLEDANATMLQLVPVAPILVLLWCTMLTQVSYGNAAFWTRALQPDSDEEGESQSQSINRKIVQCAATVVYCDYVYENPGETEQLAWLLSCHAFRLVTLSSEPPVRELIAAAHRSVQNSKIFMQAIGNVVTLFSKASVFNRLLACLEATHPSHSGQLVRLFVHHLLWHPHAALARRAALLCTRRAEYLLTLPPDQVSSQVSRQQLIQVLEILQCAHQHWKHSALINVLNKLGAQCYNLSPVSLEQTGTPSPPASTDKSPVALDRTWYLGQVALRCSGTAYAVEESALLVGRLDFDDAVNILSSPDTPLSILQHSFRHGVYLTLHATDVHNSSSNAERQPSPLYQASKSVLLKLLRQFKEKVSISRQPSSDAECPFRRCDKESLFQLAGATVWFLKSLPLLNDSVPAEAVEDLAHLAIKCLQAVGSNEERASHLEISLECADRVIGEPAVSKLLEEPQRSPWLVSACTTLSKLVKKFVYGGSVPTVPDGGLAESLASCGKVDAATACLSMSSLVVWLEKHQQDRATQNIPKFLYSIFRSLVVRLCRIQALFINSFVTVPPDAWRHGWTFTFKESITSVPSLPPAYLQDMDILQQFIFRITLLGWKNRLQFEETWMSLLSVLNTQLGDEETSADEVTLIAQTKTVAIQAISCLLLQTLLVPVPGNPNCGRLLHVPRDQPLNPSADSDTGKLKSVQQQLVWKVESLEGVRAHTVFDRPNLERLLNPEKVSYSQVSVEYLRCGVARAQPGGLGDAKDVFAEKVIEAHDTRDKLLQESGLDVNSCLFFLLELFNQWTQPMVNTGVGNFSLHPQCDGLRAALAVSDLFTEFSQWQWLLKTALTLAPASTEDDALQQYVVLAQCKACALVEPSNDSCERVRRYLEISLRSPSVSTRCAGLHGLLYLLQAEILNSFRSQDVSPSEPEQSNLSSEHRTAIVNLVSNYLMKHTKNVSSIDETHTILVWTVALYLLDNVSYLQTESLNQAAPSLVQQAIGLARPNSGASASLQKIIIEGLERLVVSQSKALSDNLFKQVTLLSVECVADVSPCDLLPALQLFLSCMYIGMNRKSTESDQTVKLSNKDRSDSDLAEKLVAAMEKTSVLFERIKKGYPFEVELVCAVLPSLLTDFFPASEVLTKVIGEFLSQQQPHPRLLAGVVFQVFERAVAQNQLALLQDWVVISLANFTQSLPLPMASWCLTCFFISASCNSWLRALFPHVQSRIGRCELEDRKLLCLAAADFYHQLSETQKSTFVSTFQAAVENQPNSPFCSLIAGL